MIEDVRPKWLFLSGFAATIDPDNLKLGDVVVAQHIFDISAGKQTPKGARLDLHSYPPDDGLQETIRVADHTQLASHIIADHPEGNTKHKPTIHTVDTLCGSKVVADKKYRSRIKDASGRKAKALEMEGYGVAYALNSFPKELQTTEFAMVKGVADEADVDKGDEWHRYASEAAAAYIFEAISSVGSKDVEDINRHEGISDDQLESMAEIAGAALVPSVPGQLPYKQDQSRGVLRQALKEVHDIGTDRHEIDLQSGHQFLLRSEPVFARARRLYAVSYDAVSTFWVEELNRKLSRKYRDAHPKDENTHRLFVFSDAASAHNYAKVLDSHVSHYDNVYICDLPTYRRILSDWQGTVTVEELLTKDFAVLEYDAGDPDDRTHVFAEYSGTKFANFRIKQDVVGELNYLKMTSFFCQLAKRCQDQGEDSTWTFDNSGLLRWERGMWQQKTAWVKALKHMFPDSGAQAVHIVLFTVAEKDRAKLREKLAQVKYNFLHERPAGREQLSARQRYGILDVLFGSALSYDDSPPRDKQSGGVLRLSAQNRDNYVLVMRFSSRAGLKEFYEDDRHSKLREEIYELLDPRLCHIFEVIHEPVKILPATPSGEDDGRSRVKEDTFGLAEKVMADKLKRRDFEDDEMIDHLVAVDPFAP